MPLLKNIGAGSVHSFLDFTPFQVWGVHTFTHSIYIYIIMYSVLIKLSYIVQTHIAENVENEIISYYL